ncbi:uncharacterized membrane protein YebE (DUF533 family) [Brevundimonas bullata]|uniref:Uncharacterized membrane protein YebE (DUF533 family) n=1 Tax=Brevundimonas bullata TaxID=13160 RepID=A0A7W7N2I4_9CAUL|nr:cysteine protease [Brevundimonas bullata]MBB4796471.1 uncharacterized membrane protein YebE (DUF533 family) [Brevundimonas bullata]MBB6381431.1 uncharacterized membrane protein YebE (DUF533 family) [Brevundimonas bullata]
MRLPRLSTVLGGLLLSRRGRAFAGRHAGKLAFATLAFELWQKHQTQQSGAASKSASATRPTARHHARSRWSGRSRR